MGPFSPVTWLASRGAHLGADPLVPPSGSRTAPALKEEALEAPPGHEQRAPLGLGVYSSSSNRSLAPGGALGRPTGRLQPKRAEVTNWINYRPARWRFHWLPLLSLLSTGHLRVAGRLAGRAKKVVPAGHLLSPVRRNYRSQPWPESNQILEPDWLSRRTSGSGGGGGHWWAQFGPIQSANFGRPAGSELEPPSHSLSRLACNQINFALDSAGWILFLRPIGRPICASLAQVAHSGRIRLHHPV